MMSLVYVFLGGGLGSIARYSIGQWINTEDQSFPLGTFSANILACLILGFLIGYQERVETNVELMLLLATGFCGGFSTFSTFGAESVILFQNQQVGTALLYIGVSILAGLVSIFVGYKFISIIYS